MDKQGMVSDVRKRASVSFKTEGVEAIAIAHRDDISDHSEPREETPFKRTSVDEAPRSADARRPRHHTEAPTARVNDDEEPNVQRSRSLHTTSVTTKVSDPVARSTSEAQGGLRRSSGTTPGDTNIKVAVRVRPFNDKEKKRNEDLIVDAPSDTLLSITNPKLGDGGEPKLFSFDRVFWSVDKCSSYRNSCGQDTLMKELGEELVYAAVDGYNCCLFAYGQTGSGKTHTMLGNESKPENRGLLPRIVEGLFAQIEHEKQESQRLAEFTTSVSYLEIYNETIRDLLAPEEKSHVRLEVRHHPKLGSFVPGANDTPVFCVQDVNKLLSFGVKARAVGATLMNECSSRSHCIFALETTRKQQIGGKVVTLRSKLNLVDLAGSERQKRTHASGDQLKEGASINKSLSTLALIVSKLAEQCAAGAHRRRRSDVHMHIPFRNSKLTFLLQESLSGNSKTAMIAALSPASMSYEETLSTLHFAQSVKAVKMTTSKNEESGAALLQDLEAECERLREQVAAGTKDHQELHDFETMREKYGRNLEEQLAIAKEMNEERNKILEDAGLTTEEMSQSLGLHAGTPQLLNVLPDPQLSNCLVYFLQQDRTYSVGTSDECKIYLQGIGMEGTMVELQNKDNKCVILRRREEHDGFVRLNGRLIGDDEEVELMHDDRLIFGYSYCFRVVIPNCAAAKEQAQQDIDTTDLFEKAMQEVLPDSFEADGSGSLFLRELEQRLGEVRARKFSTIFRKVSMEVEEANALIRQSHPEMPYVFSAEVLQDFVSASMRVPECIIRLKKVPRGIARLRAFVNRHSFGVAHNKLKEAMGELKSNVDDHGTFETTLLLTTEDFRQRLAEFQDLYCSARRRRSRSGIAFHSRERGRSSVTDVDQEEIIELSRKGLDPFTRLISSGREAEHLHNLQEANARIQELEAQLEEATDRVSELEALEAAGAAASPAGSAIGSPEAHSSVAGFAPTPAPSLATSPGASPTAGVGQQLVPPWPSGDAFVKVGGDAALLQAWRPASSRLVASDSGSLAPLEVQAKLLEQVRQAFEHGLQRDAAESQRLLHYTERLQACEAHHLRICRDLQAEVRTEAKRLSEQSDLIRHETFENSCLREEVRGLRDELTAMQSRLQDEHADAEIALEMAEFYIRTGHQGRVQESEAACVKELLGRIRTMHEPGGGSTSLSPRP